MQLKTTNQFVCVVPSLFRFPTISLPINWHGTNWILKGHCCNYSICTVSSRNLHICVYGTLLMCGQKSWNRLYMERGILGWGDECCLILNVVMKLGEGRIYCGLFLGIALECISVFHFQFSIFFCPVPSVSHSSNSLLLNDLLLNWLPSAAVSKRE
jgi:hypothetical protein